MSTHKSFKVLTQITPNVGVTDDPHGEMKIHNDKSLFSEWSVTFSMRAGETVWVEWVLTDFRSYSTAFNAASREAIRISIERDLVINIVSEVTE